MTPARLRQIEELYHAAYEASAGERASLLERADPELRREVESLLARQNDRLILDRSVPLLDDPTMTALKPGVRLGPYQVESKIGEGGMGEVFAPSTHASAGPSPSSSSTSGETLAARLKSGPLPVDQALRYASQIASALAAAHERGIVHRDLKPGNIMIGKSGVKVLDFGLATWEGDDSITGSRMVIGTPAYMAPEQREGKPSDARTDLYSFGRVFYEMLTGARATPDRKPVPSKALESIVSRCLEADPARRWQSAVELASALEAPPRTGPNRIWMVPAAVIAVALLMASYFFLRPAPKLTDKDIIVLADFVNNTGDPVFDGTLRQGLAVQLEQSPFLKIMDDEQVQRVLRLMSLPSAARITNQIAREICVREAAATSIDGTIASLGKNYVITLRAITCQDGATLAREQIQAEDKEHVLNVLGTAAAAMRGKLGESHNSIEKLNRPLEEATTGSLEALQNYSTGRSLLVQGQSLSAIPSFQRAIAIDEKFAMAYQFLAVAFEVAGDMAGSRENSKQAFGLIGRVSEFERLQIAPYYYLATGEWDKAIDGYQLGVHTYPRWWGFHNLLSMTHIDLGQFEEGLKEGLEATRWQANVEHPYRRQLDAYICLGRLAEAKQLAEKLRVQGLGGPRIHQRFLEIAYTEDDQAAIDREIQWFVGKQGEYLSLGLQAANLNVHGQRRKSHELFQRTAETALRHGLRNAASEFEEADARADAVSGNCQSVRRLGRPALALAICGDAAQAEKLAAETSKLFPNGTIWNTVQLPAIRAAIALNRDQPARALELLAAASSYERAYLEAIYLRGLAYLKLNEGAKAASEFQKIVDHKGASWASDWHHPNQGQFYSLSYLGMARASALTGATAKAKKAFQDFFELWKDADPELPILQQAKAEYVKLR